MINVGGILGAGVYSSIVGSAHIAGPAVVFTFLFTTICAIFSSFPYAEFSSQISDSGASYSFTYNSIGEFVAFMYTYLVRVGHSMFLNFTVSGSAIAKSWSGYFGYLLEFNGAHTKKWLPIIWRNEYFVSFLARN